MTVSQRKKREGQEIAIEAIGELHKLYLNGEIEIEIDLNVFVEGWQHDRTEKQRIQEKWGEIRLGPTFVGFWGKNG